jgi:hypothetical protein
MIYLMILAMLCWYVAGICTMGLANTQGLRATRWYAISLLVLSLAGAVLFGMGYKMEYMVR